MGTAPAAATRPAALPTAGTARTAMWETARATATALRPARREVLVQAVAALPIVDLDRTAMLDTTPAARVEVSTTGALAAVVSSSIIRMEATGSRFPWQHPPRQKDEGRQRQLFL